MNGSGQLTMPLTEAQKKRRVLEAMDEEQEELPV